MIQTDVILVDPSDHPIGQMEKMEAHHKGVLHRAFSIFLFNSRGEMLLQQRSSLKYHSGGLWTNACCSHPYPGEETSDAAKRRLKEELGIDAPLEKAFDFVYRADMGNGLTEYEFDHVYAGEYEGDIFPNPEEVENYSYLPVDEIRHSFSNNPGKYTAWFLLAFPKIIPWWAGHYPRKN